MINGGGDGDHFMTVKGRPRKPGNRRPCGALTPTVDLGSPDLLRHRAEAILGSARIDDIMTVSEARDQRAAYALGVLFARAVIDQYQHAVGCRYQRMCNIARYHPPARPTVLATIVKPNVGGDVSSSEPTETHDEQFIRVRAEYLTLQKILARQDAEVRKILDDVVVFGAMPRDNDIVNLKMGLRVLQQFFREDGL